MQQQLKVDIVDIIFYHFLNLFSHYFYDYFLLIRLKLSKVDIFIIPTLLNKYFDSKKLEHLLLHMENEGLFIK